MGIVLSPQWPRYLLTAGPLGGKQNAEQLLTWPHSTAKYLLQIQNARGEEEDKSHGVACCRDIFGWSRSGKNEWFFPYLQIEISLNIRLFLTAYLYLFFTSLVLFSSYYLDLRVAYGVHQDSITVARKS